ncbi:hypothetical protein RvY_04886 [Ramazzottius varieornatus]|uniref:G domain-containing protein n=1 Tax=Ramazzottius varieornatus TaxID=947166 RepID=A0A1D1UWC7_RAMVA|nr:hypothetical protein RvY_04886 [Ramazzottius varieornatus]
MFLTLSPFVASSITALLHENVLDFSSPLYPIFGTASFLALGGYFWRRHDQSIILKALKEEAIGNVKARRKTLQLLPINISEVNPDERKRNVVVVGLTGAGKTSFLNAFLHPDTSFSARKEPLPTMGVKMTIADLHGLKQTYYEVGGNDNTLMFIKEFVHMAHLVIFVVDAAAEDDDLAKARELYQLIAKERHFVGPVVVLAGKQDLPGAKSVVEIYHILEIAETDDAYVLPASFVSSSYDQDEFALESQATITATKNIYRNIHTTVGNLLYRTIL